MSKALIWYGISPLPGFREKLVARGFALEENPSDDKIKDALLAATPIVVFNHGENSDDQKLAGYKHLPIFINHGVSILILANKDDHASIRQSYLNKLDPEFPWDLAVKFQTDLIGVNFDVFVDYQQKLKWKGTKIVELDNAEKLTTEERLLVSRAFQKAQELHIREIKSGFTKSRVFMVYEKRIENSIAHWAQPRLVKIGGRRELFEEVGNMKAASPFVPFELRPNLDVHVEGFQKSIFVADFVEKSESMFEAARAGRAETAISNLFNRTLHRWRDRAWQCPKSSEPLAKAAERLQMLSPTNICTEYLESEKIQNLGIDVQSLWKILEEISFEHRSATIHGDLHGDNVRVRGDDAILIDLGSVKGADGGAPICFDVAMLEVALMFACADNENQQQFEQPDWENEIRPFYQLNAILSTPSRDSAPKPISWRFDCLQRVRAFGIYNQSDPFEYAIALVIALWRWCKFRPLSPADKGRRVVALAIGAALINQINERRLSS